MDRFQRALELLKQHKLPEARQLLELLLKDPSRVDFDDVQRKREAAEIWCKQRRMEYVIAMIR